MGIDSIQQPAEEITVDDTLELGAPETPQLDGDGNPIEAKEPIDDAFPDTFDEDGEVQNPHLVAQLREDIARRKERERDLERRLAAPKIVRTPKPTIDGCEYDEDRYDAALLAWRENEAAADAQERQPAPKTVQNDDFQAALTKYNAGNAKIGAAAETSRQAVIAALDEAQQSAILLAVQRPAEFFHALGRSPNRLAALSLITNPIKLAAEVARIEGKTTMPRREPPNIDTPLRGGARIAPQSGDAKADAMVDKAAKNGGDTTALLDHERAKRRAKAA